MSTQQANTFAAEATVAQEEDVHVTDGNAYAF
jgi:hypothetical protein